MDLSISAPIKYIREVREELTRVIWPKRKEVIQITSQIVVIAVFFAVYIGGLDFLFTKINQLIIK